MEYFEIEPGIFPDAIDGSEIGPARCLFNSFGEPAKGLVYLAVPNVIQSFGRLGVLHWVALETTDDAPTFLDPLEARTRSNPLQSGG